MIVITGCQTEPESVEVVVTRVITETIQVEGESVEVTRLVEVPVEVEVTAESTEAPSEPAAPKILRIAGILDGYILDEETPANVTVGMGANRLPIFENLTHMDENFQLQPWLATSWEYDPDRSVWTFQLRDDVFFHNGEQLTAQTVADHFNLLAEGSTMQSLLEIEENAATAVGDFKVEIVSSNVQLPMSASHMTMGIRQGDAFAGEFIGTGPFKFVEYIPGDHITVEKNPDYWGDPTALDGIELIFMPDPLTRMLALQAGDVHVIYSPAREGLPALEGRDEIILYPTVPASHQQLDLNITGETFNILQDPLVREALGYAIDRQEIINVGWGGFAVESQTMVAQALLGDSAANIQGYTYDPDRAVSLLEEAGWVDEDEDGIREKDGRRLTLRMVNGWPNAEENGSTPEVLQSQLAEVGIEIVIIPVADFPTLANYLIPKEADIFLEIWTNTSPSPCLMPRFGFYGGGEEPNIWQAVLSPAFAGFEDVNEEIDNCSASTSQEEASQWASEALHTIFDEARTSIGLVGLYQTWATTDEVTGFIPHPIQGYVRWEAIDLVN
jgi:peptide/nickel transport system substrate-binding protein